MYSTLDLLFILHIKNTWILLRMTQQKVLPAGRPPDLVLPAGRPPDLVLPTGRPPDLVLPAGRPPDLVLPAGRPPDLVLSLQFQASFKH